MSYVCLYAKEKRAASEMPRPSGKRNPQYAARRRELLEAIREHLAKPNVMHASLRELSLACGVSVPTLRHYFGNRDGVICAVLEDYGARGAGRLKRAAEPVGSLCESVKELCEFFCLGFEQGRLGQIHAIGLTEGLRHAQHGTEYLNYIVEPTLQAVEQRLQRHVERGEMRPCNLRYAAIMLVSSILTSLLHQNELGGAEVQQLSMDNLISELTDAFMRAFANEDANSNRDPL